MSVTNCKSDLLYSNKMIMLLCFSGVKYFLTWMRCEGTVTTATANDDLSKARSPYRKVVRAWPFLGLS